MCVCVCVWRGGGGGRGAGGSVYHQYPTASSLLAYIYKQNFFKTLF